MLKVRYLPAAERALVKHRNRAALLKRKIEEYAANPGAHSNNVMRLVGEPTGYRLRVGDFRALLKIEGSVMTVVDIGPRGSIYKR